VPQVEAESVKGFSSRKGYLWLGLKKGLMPRRPKPKRQPRPEGTPFLLDFKCSTHKNTGGGGGSKLVVEYDIKGHYEGVSWKTRQTMMNDWVTFLRN
jgi:hypothetical protein